MQIESIQIENYRVFRGATFTDLPKMTVVVGANGSGKSTLFDVCFKTLYGDVEPPVSAEYNRDR